MPMEEQGVPLSAWMFACPNYLRVEPQNASSIILACIVLHNIATQRSAPLCDITDSPEPLAPADDPGPPVDFPLNERRWLWTSNARCYCPQLLLKGDHGWSTCAFFWKLFLFNLNYMCYWHNLCLDNFMNTNSLFGLIHCSERYARGHCKCQCKNKWKCINQEGYNLETLAFIYIKTYVFIYCIVHFALVIHPSGGIKIIKIFWITLIPKFGSLNYPFRRFNPDWSMDLISGSDRISKWT